MKNAKTKRVTKKENELVKENMERFNTLIDYIEVSFNPRKYVLEAHITIELDKLQDCISFLGNEEARKFIGNAVLEAVDKRANSKN